MKKMLLLLSALLPLAGSAQTTAPHPLTARDLQQLRDVKDAHFSPDGQWVTYVVSRPDTAADKNNADVWMARYDGSQNLRVTTSPDNETSPRFSPDGQYLSFLSSRGEGEEGKAQLWLLNRRGGEAEKVTKFKGSVQDYVWAPDGRQLALIIRDADPDSLTQKQKTQKKTPPVIVIDRFQFKQDVDGYLNAQRQHLYLFDVATRRLTNLTPGRYDEHLPAWSPDSRQLAFVSKRGPDPDRHDNYDLYVMDARAGAQPRPLTTTDVADSAPGGWSGRPAWSPDGRQIAFVEGAPREQLVYGLHQLAVVPVAGGEPRLLMPGLDRNTGKPQWSADGKMLYFLLEDDRAQVLARVPVRGGQPERVLAGQREITEFELDPKGQIVVVNSEPQQPREVFAFEKKSLRPVSQQNDAWLETVQLGAVEPIRAASPGWHPGQRVRGEAGGLRGGPALPHGAADSWRAGGAVCLRLRARVAAAGRPRLRGGGRQPPRQLGPGPRIQPRHLCRLGPQGLGRRPGRGGLCRAAGPGRPRPPGRGRLELRRHPDRPPHRPRPRASRPLPAGPASPTCWPVTAPTSTSAIMKRNWVRPGSTPDVWLRISYPFFHARPDQHAHAVSVRRKGFQRAAAQYRADVPGPAEPARCPPSSSSTPASSTASTSPAM